jgi:retron-type reverse transcriptase
MLIQIKEESAWKRVRANKGSPGIDGISFTDIEGRKEGVQGFLEGIRASLINRTYRPDPVRRVYIPKVVYDADLKAYFDTIPHDNLMKAVEIRIVDRSVLNLLRMWLKSVIVDTDENGKQKRYRSKIGTPQGGVISPLLANIYLNYFEKHFNFLGFSFRFENGKHHLIKSTE